MTDSKSFYSLYAKYVEYRELAGLAAVAGFPNANVYEKMYQEEKENIKKSA